MAGVGIGAGCFGGDGDASEVERGLHRVDIRAARLDCAADAAKQVELIADIEAYIVELAILHRDVRAIGGSRLTPVAGAAVDGRGGEAAGAHLAQHRARSGEIGGGFAEVGIVSQRLLNEPVEQRVFVEAPPLARRLVAREGGRLVPYEGGLTGCVRRGRAVVGTDRGAARQGQSAHCGKKSTHHFAGPSGAVSGSWGVPP